MPRQHDALGFGITISLRTASNSGQCSSEEPVWPMQSCTTELETGFDAHLPTKRCTNRLGCTLAAKDVERAIRVIEIHLKDLKKTFVRSLLLRRRGHPMSSVRRPGKTMLEARGARRTPQREKAKRKERLRQVGRGKDRRPSEFRCMQF